MRTVQSGGFRRVISGMLVAQLTRPPVAVLAQESDHSLAENMSQLAGFTTEHAFKKLLKNL